MPSLPLDDLLAGASLSEIFDIPAHVIDCARRMAYQSHLDGRHEDAALICRGLLAADHHCPWSRSLYAASLRALGHPAAALAQVQRGLRHHPDHPVLVALHADLAGAPPEPTDAPAPAAEAA